MPDGSTTAHPHQPAGQLVTLYALGSLLAAIPLVAATSSWRRRTVLLIPIAQQGRALALAMIVTPLALSLGVPAGTLLGTLVGWRSAFGIMSAIALLLAVWVWRFMPDFPGRTAGRRLSVSTCS